MKPLLWILCAMLSGVGLAQASWHTETTDDGGTVTLTSIVLANGETHSKPASIRNLTPPPSGDYYVEARIRAIPDTKENGQLYLLGRHDNGNWPGAGLSIINGTIDVNLMRMQAGALTRIKQVRRLAAGTGTWHLLRLEMAGPTLTVYLNGEKVGTAQDPAFAQLRGNVGYYSKGKAFDIDDMRVGAASDKPMRIAPSLSGPDIRFEAGDTPRLVGVSAKSGDGTTPFAFTAVSNDSDIARVAAGAQGVTITPLRAGATSILLASVTDPAVQTTLKVSIGPRFASPAAALPNPVFPSEGARAVPVDTTLRIAFAQPPTLGATGSVRIYRKRDRALVDVIRVGEEVAAIGPAGADQKRYVRRTPITVAGNNVIIRPHSGVLAYDTEYVVAVGAGVFDGVAGRWSFRTRKSAPIGTTLTVDDDGAADFRTVQGALDHAMVRYPRPVPVTVAVRNGSYEELLFIRSKDRLSIVGESRDGVLIHAANNDGIHPGSGASQRAGAPGFSGGRSLLMVEDADLLTLDTLTLRNTTLRRQSLSAQAETVYFNSDAGRLVARNANFFSEQDTLQLKGYAWFYRTLVAGNVDFIWGANRVALFEQSEIRSVGDSAHPQSGGYLVQARTVTAADKGFIFLNSTLTHGAGPAGNAIPAGRTFLARSPGTVTTWDNVSFINCRMDSHIAAIGWAGSGAAREPAPNPALADAVHGWREHGSTDLAGRALDLSQRRGGRLLDAGEVHRQFGSRAAIFAAFDVGKGWDPQP